MYLLINFGDFVDGNVSTTAAPYVQLLSTTNPAAAHADFVSVRLNQTGAPASTSAPPDHAAIEAADVPSASASSSVPKNVKNAFMKEKIPIIIVLSIGIGLVVLGAVMVFCSRKRLSRRGRDSLASTYRSYQQLNAPAPAGDMRPVRGYQYGQPAAYPHAAWGRP